MSTTDPDRMVPADAVAAAIQPLLDRISDLEQRLSNVNALSLFPRYPLSELVATVERLADHHAATVPASSSDTRMIADFRERGDR